jgi:hypothetical protein
MMCRLRRGVFTGIKIGRNWFMTDADIEAAIESCRNEVAVEPEPVVSEAVTVVDGLSARSRRRLRARQ